MNDWARTALSTVLRRCFRALVADLEREAAAMQRDAAELRKWA